MHFDSGLGDHGRSTKGSERAGGGFYVSQRVNHTPPLSTSNHFDVLEVYSVEDNSTDLTDEMTAQDVQQTPTTPKASPTYPIRLKHWERQLPRKYVVTATPSANSLNIKVKIVTTDTQETKSVKALLDCRAEGLFINQDYIWKN